MNLFTSILFNTSFGKWFISGFYGLTTIALFQDASVNNQSFFTSLLKYIPAKILFFLGIIYGCALVFKFLSSTWTRHKENVNRVKLSDLEVRMKNEELNREIIDTKKDNKELEDLLTVKK